MPSVIQNILGRATISDYKKFVPNSIIDLINLSEQSPPNYELVKAQAVHFNLKVGLNNLSDFKNLKPNSLNIYEASKGKFNLDFGKSNESGGQLSRESLTTASSFLKVNKIKAVKY